MSSDIINAHHRVAILFVEALDPKFREFDNTKLLQQIAGKSVFTIDSYDKCKKSPWRMQSIYKDDQKPVRLNDNSAIIHAWFTHGSTSAHHSLTILTNLQKAPDGRDAILPAGVFVPEKLIGQEFPADTTNGVANFKVKGIGWGTTFSCCKSNQTVDFHLLFTDKHGNVRNQSRPSELFDPKVGVITQAYAKNGLIQHPNGPTLHAMEHQFRDIIGESACCGHKTSLTANSMKEGSKAAPAPTLG